MVKRRAPATPTPSPNPSLLISHRDAEEKLSIRIDLGKEIQSASVRSEADLDQLKLDRKKWDSYNHELLKRTFDNESIAEEYNRVSLWGSTYVNMDLRQSIVSFKEGLANKIAKLESIIERLELIPAPTEAGQSQYQETSFNNKNIFIVHGHDDAAKVSVARFLEKLHLNPIILHEQANKGQTIIEKFEEHASDVGFAIVLLTPDDIGAARDHADKLAARARQNVILELGYFCGALGRDRVCVLYKEGVEIPNDYLGVIYTPFDNGDGWHLKLAKEMKAAGLEFDMNLAF